jgi:hypothetical protein
VGAVLRVRVLGEQPDVDAARDWFAAAAGVASAELIGDALLGLGFTGDDAAAAALLADAVAAGIRVVSFAHAASDLEELFLQVTGERPVEVA